ncbi:L,D-transpeptidase family protein [Aggregatilinea lenta]|uniref:L,D-transpeptidase family protein n=1 Tax=Aggregatilinea lenta TaxID=913108 RepID=UPI000E5BB624|nr:L,D-transpeptidase family protein [Aggregatilinea lenta]
MHAYAPSSQPPERYLRPARPRRVRPNSWLVWSVVVAVAFASFGAMASLGIYMYAAGSEATIPANVSVAGVEVGGMRLDEAQSALAQALPAQAITARDGSRAWNLTPSDVGISIDLDATMQLAADAAPGEAITPWYTVDLVQAQTGLFALSEEANIDAVPGDPPQMGRVMDVPVLLDRMRVDLRGELADGALDLPMIEVAPPEEVEEPEQTYTGATTVHVVEAGQELALIALDYGVTTDEIVALNSISDPDLLYVGQELVIPATGEYTPTAAEAPTPSTTSGKAIVVSTQEQRIYAYENGQLVHSHLASTGLPDTPTVLGDYKIYVKYVADDMSGPDYYLPQVPYTMYFYQGYGIHGTYWHNSFGRPMSHGCVNLPTAEAKWFFDWAEVGTPVRVI